MSRSYNRFMVAKDRDRRVKRRYKAKTLANRAVRRSDIPGGRGAYKKLFDSYMISDWRIMQEQDENELHRKWNGGDPVMHLWYSSYSEAERNWKKRYKWK